MPKFIVTTASYRQGKDVVETHTGEAAQAYIDMADGRAVLVMQDADTNIIAAFNEWERVERDGTFTTVVEGLVASAPVDEPNAMLVVPPRTAPRAEDRG